MTRVHAARQVSHIGFPQDRAMTGGYNLLSDEDDTDYHATLAGVLDTCAGLCGWSEFMSLQSRDECFCSDPNDQYDKYGRADDADCQWDADSVVGGVAQTAGTTACGQGRTDTGDSKCGWRNAVYTVPSRGRNPDYKGCFVDGGVTRGGWSNDRDNGAYTVGRTFLRAKQLSFLL